MFMFLVYLISTIQFNFEAIVPRYEAEEGGIMGCCESTPSRCSFNPQTQNYQLQYPKVAAFEDKEGGSVIYVENLPRNISATQVEKEFKKFGKIKSEKIQVRNEGSNACAFIEFETKASAAKAIQASPLVICRRRIFVEEKRSSSCNIQFGGIAREERRTARYNECQTPCNSPNAEECSTSCNSPNAEELEQCHEFSFPILT